jgi:hypothetical protein
VAAPFRRLELPQFAELVRLFDFKRTITSFHVHHTFIPRRGDFKGLATIEAMDRVHRTERGFSEIAQHITLAPDGVIWTGRSWNKPPASALGFNGNSKAGPFMMEMVGNFDRNEEPFDGPQADNAFRIVAVILRRFGLGIEAVHFHNEMSAKTCPGSAVVKADFVRRVQEALDELPREVEGDEECDAFLSAASPVSSSRWSGRYRCARPTPKESCRKKRRRTSSMSDASPPRQTRDSRSRAHRNVRRASSSRSSCSTWSICAAGGSRRTISSSATKARSTFAGLEAQLQDANVRNRSESCSTRTAAWSGSAARSANASRSVVVEAAASIPSSSSGTPISARRFATRSCAPSEVAAISPTSAIASSSNSCATSSDCRRGTA